MTIVRIKGFKVYRDRHGKQRCYHRKTGAAVDLIKQPFGSAEFIAECARINALAQAAPPPKPGTLGALIHEFRLSPKWQVLETRTRQDYERVFMILEPIAATPLAIIDTPLVVRMRDKTQQKKGWHFANRFKINLSAIFGWGMERGYMQGNPAQGIRNISRPKDMPRANRPWADEERFAVLAAAPARLREILTVMAYTGLDPCDAIALKKADYDGKWIRRPRQKTKQWVYLIVPAHLKQVLDNIPLHEAATLLANTAGKPWTKSGLDSAWKRLKPVLEADGRIKPGLTLKGLRHTVGTILREEGMDERTIADALGQKTVEMARHYSRDADLKKKMEKVADVLDSADKRRREDCLTEAEKLSNRSKAGRN